MKNSASNNRVDQWTRIIEAARRHPGGVADYCREHKINLPKYYYWFRRLRNQHPEWAAQSSKGKKIRPQRDKDKARETEVEPKARRRKFTANEKEKILQEVDAAGPGKVGAILRRVGIYYSTLQKWREQRTDRDLTPKKRGPLPNPGRERTDQLLRRIAQLEKKLRKQDLMLELQKKIAEILETEKGKDEP